MPRKENLLKQVETDGKSNYSKGEVKNLLIGVTVTQIVTKVKIGDIFTGNQGFKGRPFCVCKIIGNMVYALPLSTTEDSFNLIPLRSRFFKDGGWINKGVYVFDKDFVRHRFIGSVDSAVSVRKAWNEQLKSLL